MILLVLSQPLMEVRKFLVKPINMVAIYYIIMLISIKQFVTIVRLPRNLKIVR